MSRYWYDVIAAVCVHSSDYQTHDVLEKLLTILAVHCLLLRPDLAPYVPRPACMQCWVHAQGQRCPMATSQRTGPVTEKEHDEYERGNAYCWVYVQGQRCRMVTSQRTGSGTSESMCRKQPRTGRATHRS